MSLPQPPVPLEQRDKDTRNVNAKRTAVSLEDITNEMQPKPPESNTIDYAKLLASSRVKPSDIIEEDPICLTIEKEGKTSIIGTLGNLSTVAGRAKAKKTFAVSFAVAAAITCQLVLNRIKGMLPENKRTVLLFDTEQSKHHVLKVVKRICRLCSIPDPPNLLVYSLRPYAPNDRLKAIDFALKNTPNVGLVVIDGVRDLAVDPILDSEQASHIITHLLQWTDQLNIHIMCVLHQNKSDTNLRGHLGTELVNKSETVISVTRNNRNKEISHVEADYCRNREFDPFSFSVDDNGTPYLVDEESSQLDRTDRASKPGLRNPDLPTAETMSTEMVKAIIQRAFTQHEQLAYGQLKANIIEASQYAGVTLSDTRARSFIQRVVLDGKLTSFRPDKARWDFYKITSESTTVNT